MFATRLLSACNQAEVYRIEGAAGTLSLGERRRVAKFGGEPHRDIPASGRGVANPPAAAERSPRDGRIFMPLTKPNAERGPLIHSSVDLTQDNTVRALLRALHGSGSPVLVRDVDIDNSDSPSAVAFSPLGDDLLIALHGTNEVAIFVAPALADQTGFGANVVRLDVGLAPQGLDVEQTTGRTFVHNFMGRSLSVLATGSLWAIGNTQVARQALPALASEPLSAQVLAGKRIFSNACDLRMSAEG